MLPTKTITVGSTTVEVEVATTEKEHEAGLSGRTGLKDGTGMLFVFEQEGMYIFWMKDMLFPIDMVWIDADGVVVSVTANATPQSYNQDHPQTFRPISPALYVLELPAGYAAAHDIAEGSKVVL
ncbi:MAG: hypothetical protein JWO43_659 [Candidatus Adlerbacteria bacterium]|nr:hypothetical protein [Candidatus Adlerbacteria bacterium]